MHEVSIALAVVDELTARIASDGTEKITAVYLRIGKLTAVDTQAMNFAWDLVTEGTLASNSRLQIETVPLKILCKTCATEQIVEGVLPICPRCGSSSDSIVAGRELIIAAVEVLDAGTNRGSPTEHPAKEQHLRS